MLKIAQANGDWRDEDEAQQIEIQEARKLIGEPTFEYRYEQSDVDSWVVFLATKPLVKAQLDQLWENGDLWPVHVIEGKDFTECLAALIRVNGEFCASDE